MPAENEGDRTLTDADVNAIVDRAREVFKNEFYKDLGRGVWAYAKRALIWLIVGLAAYGYLKGK